MILIDSYKSVPFLLDIYQAKIAYGLSQLKTGVPIVVRVRRSSDDTEQDFTATQVVDGTLLTFTGSSNGFVVTLYDLNGGASENNATQTAKNAQPRIVNAGVLESDVSGKPFIRFDGVDDFISLPIGFMGSDDNTFALFSTCATRTNYANGGGAMTKGLVIGSIDVNLIRVGVGTNSGLSSQIRFTNGVGVAYSSGQSVTTNTRYIGAILSNGSNLTFYTNGSTSGGSAISNTISLQESHAIARGTSSGYHPGFSDIDFSELIIFDTDQTANRTAIEFDINSRYNIY
jgi:hypothetical protein